MIKTAIAFMLGCLLFLQLTSLPNLLWFFGLIPLLILLASARTRLISYFGFGVLWTFFQATLLVNDQLSTELEGKDNVISGVISSLPQHNGRRIRFEFTPDSEFSTFPSKLRLTWYKPLPVHFEAGDHWQLTIRLKKIHGMSNPGSFDYESWLFQQGFGATGYVRTSKTNKLLSESSAFNINKLRQKLSNILHTHLSSSPNLGLIEGLTIGVRDNISQNQWQVLRASGTNHLLAISGLHIGLAAAIGFFSFRWLWARKTTKLLHLPATEFAVIGSASAALFYAALAGFSIPTQRALIMVTVVMIAILIRRPLASSSLLSLSMLVVLSWAPFSVLSSGFWLSFSAVAIILFVSQNRFPSPRFQWLKIHTLIAFGLTPLLLLFFLKTSLIAPIANLVAIPFISFIIVPLLLLASVMFCLFEPIGILLINIADSLLSLFWPLLDYLASLSFSQWSISPLHFYHYVIIGLSTLLLLTPRGFPAKWLGIIGLSPLLLFIQDKPEVGEFKFTLLDVGQGLSAVVQTHSHTLVFDTGPKFSDSFNTGTAIVLPFLQHHGINSIDTLIISHGDNDHIGGALPLMAAMPVNNILSSVPSRIPSAKACTTGQSWQWDNVSFHLLHPDSLDIGSENDLSCVLKITNASGSILLTGDIEKLAENLLLQHHRNNLQSTVLVAPHHGSKTSSSLEFIQAINPKVVLFPVGYRNRYNFPHNSVIARYIKQNTQLFNSAVHGAISIHFANSFVSNPIGWRQVNQKIWTPSD